MTPQRIINAYKAINELANCAFPYKITRQVHVLKTRLHDEFSIVVDAEKALLVKHGGEFIGDGTYRFSSPETASKFHEEYQDFLSQESDVNLPLVDLSKCSDAIVISSAAIDALKDLVYFEEV